MRNKLISSLAGAAFSFAASGLAFAADMVKAPPSPPPAPVYNWTGWYVGVNAGASFDTVKTDFNVASANTTVMSSGPPVSGTAVLTSSGFTGSDELYPGGFIGGGQIGYNWQLSQIWVVGLEADIQGTLEKESNTLSSNFIGSTTNPPVGILTGTRVLNYQTKIDWFGTVRGRIGYLFGDGAVLAYVTGGLAYGNLDLEGTRTVISGILGSTTPFSVTQAFGHSQVNTGWTVGTGTEGKLLIPGWTYRIEYLYMDLALGDTTLVSIQPPIISVTGGQITSHTHFTDNIVRVGLNYQFH